jgi:hypothetical protein
MTLIRHLLSVLQGELTMDVQPAYSAPPRAAMGTDVRDEASSDNCAGLFKRIHNLFVGKGKGLTWLTGAR